MAERKKIVVGQQNFYGGIATNEKLGIPYSHAYSRAMDFRKKPSQMSVLPGARQVSGAVVVDLVQNIVQIPNGIRYALGDQGYVYKIDTSNVFSTVGKLDDGAHGMVYRADTDSVYLASSTTVSRIFKASTAPILEVNKYGTSKSTDSDATRTGGTATYTLTTAVNEGATHLCSFTSDIEPLYSVKLKVVTVGTGDWTVAIHDDANNELATKTITNANLTASALNEFVFSSPVRMLVEPNARTYHIHVYSTVADGTVQVATASDFSTADFEIYAPRLVDSTNGAHPIANFAQYTVVGNERYLSAWEPLSDDPSNAEWERHKVTLPPGYEVCGLASTDEFLVIAAEKRSTDASRDFQDGKLFMWDGASTTYSFYIDVPEGSPQSPFTYNNLVYCNVNGALMCWPGDRRLVKVRTFADTDTEYTDTDDETEAYPNMMGVRRGVLLLGYPSSTNNQTIQHGVYSWGAVDKNFPQVFGYNYAISTGTRTYDGSNALRIGCVRSFGDQCYISWRDDSQTGTKYGVDIVDNASDPAGSASWESLIFDAGQVFKQKRALRLKIRTKTLPSGVTIKPKWKIDRAASWTYGTDFTSGTETIAGIGNKQFFEIQWGFDVTCTGTDTPEILGVAFEFEAASDADAFN